MYNNFFSNDEVVFYSSLLDLSEKIQKYARNDYDRKRIAKNGKTKYMKYFNSTIVADYIISNSFNYKHKKNKFMWSDK